MVAAGRVLVITDDIELRQMECPPNFPGDASMLRRGQPGLVGNRYPNS